jgi:tungstate transport system substrate-binding protein
MRNKMIVMWVAFLIVGLNTNVFCDQVLRLATTTSTENSGLLNFIIPPFEKANNVKVNVIAVGTGKALKLGENGDVDVVLVHSREAEDKFVSEGFGINRKDVMYNDYLIVGPASDPAKIKGEKSVVDAFKRMNDSKAVFVSRADQSGTHMKELEIWKLSGIDPSKANRLEAGQGMGQVLQMASEKKAYTLTDRGTYASMKDKLELTPIIEGDKLLFNPYGVISVNPARHKNVNTEMVNKFIDFLISPDGQKLISDFKVQGLTLFFPSAGK